MVAAAWAAGFEAVLRGLAGVASTVGVWTILLALVTLTVGSLLVKFATWTLHLVNELQRQWRRLPGPLRLGVLCGGGVFAAVSMLPGLMRVVPWRAAGLAFGLGFYVPWWVGARFVLADRYGVYSSPREVWIAHLRARAGRRHLTVTAERSTGKKGARAQWVKPGDDRTEAGMEPPDGMSAADFADSINKGEHQPALARQMGWHQVRGMTAEPQADGTVKVTVQHQPEPPQPDPLDEERWFRL